VDKEKTKVREEEERIKPDLVRRGFEFFKYRDLPANSRAADVHIHDAVEFIYMIKGSVRITVDDREDRLSEGDLVMLRSRGVHSMRTEESPINSYYTLKIRPKLIRNLSPKNLAGRIALRFSVFNENLKHIWRKEELEGGEMLRGYRELMEKCDRDGEYNDISMLSSVLTVVFGVLSDGEAVFDEINSDANQIYESITYINENYAEDITAEQAAEKVNMSYSYFAKSFKAATGRTFTEYLNITRINEAEQMLINTDLSVSEIATRCGYNNISYFISLYKKHKGITPLSERK
jgi:AraC-like DNA-binding protein/mannose-6-phosphate isomerase-like protein (cupin superfamily)